MEAIIYQDNFIGATNTALNEMEYISKGSIEEMEQVPIISIKNYITTKGEFNADEPIFIITEGFDNSFFCIFVRMLGEKTILSPQKKLGKDKIKKIKEICLKELKEN